MIENVFEYAVSMVYFFRVWVKRMLKNDEEYAEEYVEEYAGEYAEEYDERMERFARTLCGEL